VGKRDDRRRQQAADLADDVRASNQRPNVPPPRANDALRCPATFGPCDYTMKGNDGIRRCWYCGRRKPAPVQP
jgi:hypothetical protein